MAVKLRLKRMGRKKFPVYKLVAADSRSKRDGRFIESVGMYSPLAGDQNFTFNEERVMYWMGVGAEPTDTVRNLLSKSGLLMKHLLIKRVGEEAAAEKMAKWHEAKSAPAPAKKTAKKAAKTGDEA
ncbi:MAG: 30S ribosomal protein S16 [Bacteroidetes bacterium]|nr:30S ribosomal protein S16 [Bacteroidota bacterium]